MSISFTNDSPVFKNNLMIVFSATEKVFKEIQLEDAILFLNEKEELISINIFNYKNKLPNIKKGYHFFSDNKKIIDYFGNHFKKIYNKPFLLISKILSKEKHSKSKNLFILKTKNKYGESQVLTNLDSIVVGKNYLIGYDGTFLSNGTIIQKGKINGVNSEGMLISYNSIGINKEGLVNVSDKNIEEIFLF